jgi:WD40 repeat protein
LPKPFQAGHLAAISRDGRRLVCVSKEGAAQIWDTSQDVPPLMLSHQSPVIAAAFRADGNQVVTVCKDHTAFIWDARTGKLRTPRLQHTSGINSAIFSPDGRRVATCSNDNTARVWDAATGEPLTPWLRSNGSVRFAAFSPDASRVVTASMDNTARVWEIPSAIVPHPCPNQLDPGGARQWLSPDGAWVAEGEKNYVKVFDTGTHELRSPPLRHSSEVLFAAFRADGQRLVTASDDNTARIWDVRKGELVAAPLKHAGSVLGTAFSLDGRQVATVSDDARARVWDAETGEPLTPWLPFEGTAARVLFSSEGNQVSVQCGDQEWAWTLGSDEHPLEDLRRLAEVLAASRIDPSGSLLPLEEDTFGTKWKAWQARHPEDLLPSSRPDARRP